MDLLEIGAAHHIGLKKVLGWIYASGYMVSSGNPPCYSRAYTLSKEAAKHHCKEAYNTYEEIKQIIYRMSAAELKQQIDEKFDFAQYVSDYNTRMQKEKAGEIEMSPESHFKFLKSLNTEELEVYADHGDSDAQYILGCRLYINNSIGYMFKKPLALLRSSAFAGNCRSQEKLGDILSLDPLKATISDDVVLALGLYALAESNGSETAGIKQKKLVSQLKKS
jgi:hypothetical protein